MHQRASLAVWWLRLHYSSSGGAGLIPDRGTKIPLAKMCSQKKKNECISIDQWKQVWQLTDTSHLQQTLSLLFSHCVLSNSWDSIDCSLPGSSVYGICQARILQWVAISFSRGSFQPKDQTCVSWISGRNSEIYHWSTREARYYRTGHIWALLMAAS